MEYKRVAIDTSKHVFTLHGVDAQDRPVLRREIRRAQLVPLFVKLAPAEVALEACAGSHCWERAPTRPGHCVRLILPQYEKPFVRMARIIRAMMARGEAHRRQPTAG